MDVPVYAQTLRGGVKEMVGFFPCCDCGLVSCFHSPYKYEGKGGFRPPATTHKVCPDSPRVSLSLRLYQARFRSLC